MFLAPAFLVGLLAIAAPLWLHRVTRADPTSQPFASLMFLEQRESQRTARRTIRYWLLLAARIALLAALAFAFAGPLIAQRMLPATDANARLHAIVLDASYSMQYGDRWPRALAEAESVLNTLRGADRVMLVRASGQRIEVVKNPTQAGDAGAVRAALQGLKPGLERLDFGLAMSTADHWLGSPRPPTVIHFISDLQRSGAPLRFADLEPPAGAQLQMHAVAQEPAENAFVERIEMNGGETRNLQAIVRWNGMQPGRRSVVLTIDGRDHARQALDLPAAPVDPNTAAPLEGEGGVAQPGRSDPQASGAFAPASATAVFSGLTLTPGSHRIEVRLEPADRLPRDDRHHAVIEHADPKALLVVARENSDEAAYFGAALGASDSPHLTVEQRAASALDGGALSQYSLAVIADASALSSAAARRVLDYVAAGGAVLATLGGQSERGDLPLLEGWRIGEARTRAIKVGEMAASHPVLRDSGDWRGVRFFRQRAVQVGADDKVLIAHEDGSPLLVEREIGAGRMLVLTAPIQRSWNDLAIHALFVQFIANAGRYLTGADAAPVGHTVGSVVMTGLTAAAGGQIFDPNGARVLSLAQARSAERLVPQLAGFYEIRGAGGARWLAVNVDSRESDLTPASAQFLQRWRALRRDVPSPAAVQDGAAAKAEPQSLGPLLLWVAAAVLVAELLLANRYLSVRRQ